MTKNEYNGWFNYETWVVNLWMDNEEGSYNYWREQAESAISEHFQNPAFRPDWKDDAVRALEDQLKREHEESLPELQGFAADLLNAAMSEVNWYEIAEHLVDAMIADNPELVAVEKEGE